MEEKMLAELNQINLIDLFKYFNEVIDARVANLTPVEVEDSYQSKEVDLLYAALATAKKTIKSIRENQTNPFFKSGYADMAAINDEVNVPLAAQGLTIIQPTRLNKDGQMMLHTRLCHSSGQWIESRVRLVPTKEDFQGFGSATTYMRRYQITALLCLAISDDVMDDDAEYAQADYRNNKVKGLSSDFKSKSRAETINSTELRNLEILLNGYPELATVILKKYELHSLADFPKEEYETALPNIDKWKKNWDARNKPTV